MAAKTFSKIRRTGHEEVRHCRRCCLETAALLRTEPCCAHNKCLFVLQTGIQNFHSQFDCRKVTDDIRLVDHRLYVIDDRSSDGLPGHCNFTDVLSYIISAFRSYAGNYFHIIS